MANLQSVCNSEILLFAVPFVYVRSTEKRVAEYVKPDHIIVDITKGIKSETLMTMSKLVASDTFGVTVVALSGSTRAE